MSILATDDFNRANNADLGANWTVNTGESAWKIVSNSAEPTTPSGAGDHSERYTGITWPNNQYVQAKVVAANGGSDSNDEGVGISLRCASGARTYYRVIICDGSSTNNVGISKQIAGSYTNLGFRSQTFAANGVLYAEIVGTTLQVKWNGTNLGASFTDSSIASGSPGVSLSSNLFTAILDDWEGGDLSAAIGSLLRSPSTLPLSLMVQ